MRVKHLMVLLIILVLAIQPVSAGFFTDFFNKITGRATEPEPEPEPEPELEPEPEPAVVCPPIPTTQLCSDQKTLCPQETDEKGCIVWNCNACEIPPEDVCPELPISRWCPDGETLCPMKTDEKGCTVWDCDACEPVEKECVNDIDCPEKMKCENSLCVDVGCLEEGERAPGVATSPSGIESLKHLATECCADLKGILKPDEYDENCNLKPLKIGIIGGRTVCSNCGNKNCESWETKCNCPEDCAKVPPPVPPSEPPKPVPPSGECKEGKTAEYVCEEGVRVPWCTCEIDMWVCKISPEDDCPPPVESPKTCAAKIKITFDKTGYAAGDPFEVEVGVFDSQGNPIPNYPFYARMYDDRWHTPDLQRTGADGYFRASGTAQKPPSEITKGIFNVYTKEIGSCGKVEDTTELGFRKKEPEPCGIGGCVPGPEEPEIPVEIPIEQPKIFYPCQGCELEDRCYPYGYRKKGSYCSDENDVFVGQLGDDSPCDNNFECKTNLCIGGECLSSSLWKKILTWIKRWFKPEPQKPEPKLEVDCSELLIEKGIGDYEYTKSGYGDTKESQASLISDEGEQIGTIKCCTAQYLDPNEMRGMALVCPYENREYVENLVKIGLKQAPGARFILEDYKGEKVYVDKWISMVWTHENYAIAAGRDHQQEGSVFPEDIADAYLEKYPNDLG